MICRCPSCSLIERTAESFSSKERYLRFYFERPGPHAIKLAWGHGRYLDAWSIVHTLTGVLLGLGLSAVGLLLWQAILVVLVAALLYEGLEMALGVIENIANVVVDVVLALLGTCVVFWLCGEWNRTAITVAFGAVAALDLVLVALGWRHHLRSLFRERNGSRTSQVAEGE